MRAFAARRLQHTTGELTPRVIFVAPHGQLPVGRLVNSKKTLGLGVALPSRPAFDFFFGVASCDCGQLPVGRLVVNEGKIRVRPGLDCA